jgi:parallel beta-helix repeat protein
VFSATYNILPVESSGTIYIRADGSVDPPTAPILSIDNVTYTLTNNVYGSLIVQRDNIVIDGDSYTLQGTGAEDSRGIDLSGRTNVTVKNTQIKNFVYGIWLSSSSGNSISWNNITANYGTGIGLDYSFGNSLNWNNITANNPDGISLYCSSNNSISGNTLTDNGLYVYDSYQNSVVNNTVNGKPLVYLEGVPNYTVADAGQVVLVTCENIRVEGLNLSRTNTGLELWETSNSTISGNNITANNYDGIDLVSSSNNTIFHNNFVNNKIQVYSSGSVNTWDDGYPSGGNYWSDYHGTDWFHGPSQNVFGSDGIGDTPYVIDAQNQDNYPFMSPERSITMGSSAGGGKYSVR